MRFLWVMLALLFALNVVTAVRYSELLEKYGEVEASNLESDRLLDHARRERALAVSTLLHQSVRGVTVAVADWSQGRDLGRLVSALIAGM